MIDSGQVPRGKGEKQPGEGDEIVSETVCLQRAGDLPHLIAFDVEVRSKNVQCSSNQYLYIFHFYFSTSDTSSAARCGG